MIPGEIRGINTYSEKSLHSALKAWIAQPGDRFEVEVEGRVVDVVRGDLLIEIQTRNFAAIRRKLADLMQHHRVHLIHPIAQDHWIVKQAGDDIVSRRRSPRHGTLFHLFNELIRIPHFIHHPHFSLEVLLVHDEELQQNDGNGSWRRKGWSIADRRLLGVVEQRVFACAADYAALLPDTLPDGFTTRDLAGTIRQPLPIAQKMAYCLRQTDLLQITGKQGNALVYCRARSS